MLWVLVGWTAFHTLVPFFSSRPVAVHSARKWRSVLHDIVGVVDRGFFPLQRRRFKNLYSFGFFPISSNTPPFLLAVF